MSEVVDDEIRNWVKGIGSGSCRYGQPDMPTDDNKAWIQGLIYNKPIHSYGKKRTRFP